MGQPGSQLGQLGQPGQPASQRCTAVDNDHESTWRHLEHISETPSGDDCNIEDLIADMPLEEQRRHHSNGVRGDWPPRSQSRKKHMSEEAKGETHFRKSRSKSKRCAQRSKRTSPPHVKMRGSVITGAAAAARGAAARGAGSSATGQSPSTGQSSSSRTKFHEVPTAESSHGAPSREDTPRDEPAADASLVSATSSSVGAWFGSARKRNVAAEEQTMQPRSKQRDAKQRSQSPQPRKRTLFVPSSTRERICRNVENLQECGHDGHARSSELPAKKAKRGQDKIVASESAQHVVGDSAQHGAGEPRSHGQSSRSDTGVRNFIFEARPRVRFHSNRALCVDNVDWWKRNVGCGKCIDEAIEEAVDAGSENFSDVLMSLFKRGKDYFDALAWKTGGWKDRTLTLFQVTDDACDRQADGRLYRSNNQGDDNSELSNMIRNSKVLRQIHGTVSFHKGEVRMWPPGGNDVWKHVKPHLRNFVLQSQGGWQTKVPSTNYDRTFELFRDTRRQTGSPVDCFTDRFKAVDCTPNFNNAISTVAVWDMNNKDICIRHANGVGLEELFDARCGQETFLELYEWWVQGHPILFHRIATHKTSGVLGVLNFRLTICWDSGIRFYNIRIQMLSLVARIHLYIWSEYMLNFERHS